jgi:hypothetical protein
VEQVRPLVAAGAEVVIPAGGLPMLLFARECPFVIDGALVLNGIAVAAKAAEMALALCRLTGSVVSRRGTYAQGLGSMRGRIPPRPLVRLAFGLGAESRRRRQSRLGATAAASRRDHGSSACSPARNRLPAIACTQIASPQFAPWEAPV